MFTVYHPDLAELVRTLRRQHADYLAGRWDDRRLAEYQADRFRRTVAYARQRTPFYREHLANVDIAATGPLTQAALAAIPFTTKDDLRKAQFDLLAKPVSQSWIFYETTGTTGVATPCPRDNVDTIHNNTVLTAYYDTIFRHFGTEQVIGVSGPSELHATGDTFGDVCRCLGLAVAKMWPHSPMIGFPRAIEVIRTLPITGLFGTPGMALSLAKSARAAGLDPRRDFRLDLLMLTGELASPHLLDNIGRLWGARAYNCLYASQEASVLAAAAGDGAVYLAPLINFYEVVDPVTLAPVRPDPHGVRQGELVVTNLYQGAKPLIRYRTGDLVRVLPAQRWRTVPGPRLEALGRVRDQLDLGGRQINGYDLENTLLAHVRDYLDYQILIDREDGADRLTLLLQTDLPADHPSLRRTVEHCRDALGVQTRIVFGDPGSITSTGAMVSWKAARVVDRRASAPNGVELRAARELAARRSG